MRKVLFTGLVLLTLLALVTGTVSAAPHAGGLITLVEVRNDNGGNVIFVFRASGEFAKPKLNGTVQVQGADANYGLHCSLVSDDTIQCTTSRKTAGTHVVVFLAGFIFWTYVPASSGPTEYCYNVYDLFINSQEEEAYWLVSDVHCQDTPASEGDQLTMGESTYGFWNESPTCWVDPLMIAGYYAQCPM